LLMLAQGNSLENAAQGVLQNFQLSLVESQQQRVNGLPAIVMIADQQQGQSQHIRTLSYVIEYGSNYYAFIGASSVSNFSNYGLLFQNSMGEFRELKDPEKLNRQPERIRIMSVSRNGPLSQALSQMGVP